jgi:hypothetical protein
MVRGRSQARQEIVLAGSDVDLADAFEAGRIATCLRFLLEAGYSARTARDQDELLSELLALPRCHIGEDVEKTDLDFASVWLAPPGTI